MNKSGNLNDLDIFEYIKMLKQKGIRLHLYGDNLRYFAEKNTVSEKLLKEIKENKSLIKNFLRKKEENLIPLSQLQIAYMVGQSENQPLNKVNAHYYIEYSAENINVDKIEESFNTLIKYNDILRLIILSTGQGLILDSLPKYTVKSYIFNSKAEKLTQRDKLSRRVYTYDSWPMFSLVIGKSDTLGDVLHFSFDCSLLDAWSAGHLIKQLFKIYSGKSVEIPMYTYKEYSNDVLAYKETKKLNTDKAKEYWNNRIQSFDLSSNLLFVSKLKTLNQTTFTRGEYEFNREILDCLKDYSKSKGVTLTSIMATIYMKAFMELINQKRFVINMTIFGKLPVNKNAENLLGEFTNIGLVECIDTDEDLITSIHKTQEQIFKILEYRSYDGVNILNEVRKTYPNNIPLFPVILTCMIGEEYSSLQNGFKEVYSLSQTPQVALDHHIRVIDGKLRITFDYVSELFDSKDIEKIIRIYKKYVNNFLEF